MSKVRIEKRKLFVHEYQYLRQTTDWFQLEDDVVEKALQNDLYSVCVFDGDKIIGMGRIVGDGAIYFYIQDIIVIPEYKGKGVGKIIMNSIENYLTNMSNKNSFVGLMAAEGVAGFYYQFGYKERPADKPGMSKMIS